jgi:endonuclease I/chitodextrinase
MIKKLLSFYFLLFISFISFSQVQTYYNDVDKTLTGLALKNALTTKITDTHTNILDYTPGVWEASKITDANLTNASEVTLIYGWENGTDSDNTNDLYRDNTLQDTGSGDSFRWNREHVYSKSLANPSFTTDQPGPGTDAHNLRPADRERNSTRNNFKFGEGTGNSGFSSVTYSGPSGPNTAAWFPGDEWKGDVARMMMYMYLRYGAQCLPTGVGVGDNQFTPDDMIDLFLQWNEKDPVSDLEKARNPYHEDTANNTYAQGNRNPFIDNPYLATRIWGGDSAQDLWGIYTSSDTEAPTTPTDIIASNNSTTTIDVSWTASTDNVGVTGYNVYVNNVLTNQVTTTTVTIAGLTPNTSYAIQIEAKDLINNKSAKSTAINSSTLQDTTAPTVPTNIVASNISGTTFKLIWNASTDDTAVTGYDIFVDTAFKASTTDLTYTITGLAISTTYAVTVLAKDAAAHKSAQSAAVNVTTTDGASNGVTELFISEYVEGTGTNKAIEIVNLTSSTVNLSGYDIRRNGNGGSSWSTPLALDGGSVKDITSGDVFVIGNGDNSDQNLLDEVDLVQPNNSSTNNGEPVNFNGNDPVGLFKGDVLIDIIGEFQGGSQDFAKDVTYRRKSTISSPNIVFSYATDGLTGEWDTFAVNTTDGIGSHTATLGVNDFDYTIFKMFPNPLKGNILNLTQVQDQQITTLNIYTLNGQEVVSINNPKSTVNLKGLKSGLYIVKIISNEKVGYKKLLKQ